MADQRHPDPPRAPDRPQSLGFDRDTIQRLVAGQRRRSRRELRQFTRRLALLLVALVVLVVAGSAAFSLAEGTSVAYGFIWTMDTITTVGTIATPRDTAGRVIVVALELLGIGTLAYGLATVSEFFVSGQLSGVLELRRTQKMVDSFSDHYIICGYGRVGRQVARDLRAHDAPVVVVDQNPVHRETAKSDGIALIEGQASEDEVLIEAGIERASAVVACVDSDADNIFVTLSARELRSDILIIARASAEDSEKKLLRAGADRVISPYKTTGSEMARIALHPQIGGAVDVADYRVEQIEVPPVCQGVGRTIGEARGQAVIVALRRATGALEPQPSPQAVINAGDTLVALGTPPALERLENLFQPAAVAAS
jgi:voltage-gated potassium channel